MPIKEAIIIGGGIAGVAAAIALTKHNKIKCQIFEIRSDPATIGGAINLTPNALRYLEHLGALDKLKPKGCEVKFIAIASHRTGQQLGRIDYRNLEKFGHHALRVMRFQLLDALLDTLRELGVNVQYGKNITTVSEVNDKIIASFEDGSTTQGDVLLGCDGIHSAVRTKFIDPERKPSYPGVANSFGFLDATNLRDEIPIDSTTLFSGRYGSLLLSYIDPNKTRLYVSAVQGAQDVGSREGWVVKGSDQEAMKGNLMRRLKAPTVPCVEKIIPKIESLTLYPVYKLSDDGTWSSGRMILLGDAAHAMPPQGESVGLALEDVVLLSRILDYHDRKSITDMFNYYNQLRRPRINAAVKEANFGFETIKDRGWFTTIIMDWLTWAFLACRAARKEEEFAFDVRDIALDL